MSFAAALMTYRFPLLWRCSSARLYVRVVEFSSLEDGEALLLSILEGALLRIPVYFMNKTRQEDDEVAAWILGQAGVTPGAVPEETEL